MAETFEIGSQPLSISLLGELISTTKKLALSEEARYKISSCRKYLDNKLAKSDAAFYGINTGFGSLCNVKIDAHQLEELQENLVMSHACGAGPEVPESIVQLMLLLKVQSLSFGNSGVDLPVVWRLMDFYNLGIHPVVFSFGSLGASGDLAPLAHLSLPLLGKGDVRMNSEKFPSARMMEQMQWKPLKLQSKEGLALLNGTQFMSAFGCSILIELQHWFDLANLISALSLEAWDGRTEPFHPAIHQARPHTGQIKVAEKILSLLKGSEIATREKKQVQDPYSFRCIPQVHGATAAVINHVAHVFTTEINSVTDNPNIFPKEDLILSGGNFHGQPLAMALDYLSIALHELGSISERRTYQLISGQQNLPPFLAGTPGLQSGLMIPQYTAASLVNRNKTLCTPSSIDSIPSSNGQEDHVSMGANAALKCAEILENLKSILAIEFLTAAQAMEFRRPARSSDAIEKVLSDYRKVVPANLNDRVLHEEMERTKEFLGRAI